MSEKASFSLGGVASGVWDGVSDVKSKASSIVTGLCGRVASACSLGVKHQAVCTAVALIAIAGAGTVAVAAGTRPSRIPEPTYYNETINGLGMEERTAESLREIAGIFGHEPTFNGVGDFLNATYPDSFAGGPLLTDMNQADVVDALSTVGQSYGYLERDWVFPMDVFGHLYADCNGAETGTFDCLSHFTSTMELSTWDAETRSMTPLYALRRWRDATTEPDPRYCGSTTVGFAIAITDRVRALCPRLMEAIAARWMY